MAHDELQRRLERKFALPMPGLLEVLRPLEPHSVHVLCG